MRRRPKAVPRQPAASEATAGERPRITSEGGVVTVDDSNFFDATAGGHTVVDFWASWCAPCRTFGPIFAEVAQAHSAGSVRFGACNVDQNPRTAALLGIRSIPTLVVFGADGSEVARTGALPRAKLEELVGRLVTAGDQAS